jgi:NADPH:quinone reductase-like Zn-dependent oxidoreductase
VDEPEQILIGLTSMGPGSAPLQADWPDGTLAQFALAPVSTVTPVKGLERMSAAQLAVLNRAIVPFGGLLRGRLGAGETLVVNGATGAYGTAAVLLGIAMGTARVVAAGRNAAALEALVKAAGPRVAAVQLTGEVGADAAKLREACGGEAEIAFDMVGRAGDANATLAALKSLRRGGRLVLMGSMTTPPSLSYGEIMRNNWQIIGQFMYPAGAYRSCLVWSERNCSISSGPRRARPGGCRSATGGAMNRSHVRMPIWCQHSKPAHLEGQRRSCCWDMLDWGQCDLRAPRATASWLDRSSHRHSANFFPAKEVRA